LDAAVLGPVFETRSGSGRPALGVQAAGALARAATLPVIALGGIHAGNAHELVGHGFAGLAGVDAFLEV
jgi:thiamine-phosphate pyrophosphorylase